MSGGADIVQVVAGATNELIRRGGKYSSAQHQRGLAKGGELIIKGAAGIAPGAVATAATAVSAAVPILAPVVIVAGAGYLSWCVGKWIYDEFFD